MENPCLLEVEDLLSKDSRIESCVAHIEPCSACTKYKYNISVLRNHIRTLEDLPSSEFREIAKQSYKDFKHELELLDFEDHEDLIQVRALFDKCFEEDFFQ